MDWNQPVAITAAPDMSAWHRAQLFFGHYDCRVYLTPKAYLDTGAGSLTAAKHVTHIPEGYQGAVGSVGRYCEFAECEILFAGEHDNAAPVNIGFKGSFPVLGHEMAKSERTPLLGGRPISIGNAVVISSGAKVLPGARIGDGAVIGAGAVVSRDVDDFMIAGGVPARPIRQRVTASEAAAIRQNAWWDWKPSELLARSATLQADALAHKLPAREERPRFVLQLKTRELIEIVGVQHGEDIYGFGAAPKSVQNYVAMAQSGGPYTWLADCWT